jgi:hypothetical protein
MARKHGRAEMTFATAEEHTELDKLALDHGGMSRSDLLRHAVNIAFGLNWPVPLFRKTEADLTRSGRSKRKSRRMK